MYAKVAWPCYVSDISGMQYEEIRQNSCPYRTCHPHMVAQSVKNLPAVQETWVQSLGWEDPLEKEMATHSSILAWKNLMDRRAWWAAVSAVTKSQA